MKKILVVDDNSTNMRLMRDILTYLGYEVIEAVNGKEAIGIATEHLPALIFMDIQMPVMDGFQACNVLKNDPKTRHIKIIALTSFAMKNDRDRIMHAGFDDYVSKPLNTRNIPQLIEAHIGKKDACDG